MTLVGPDNEQKVFGDYALYYDLMYEGKDYLAEVNYIHNLIQKHLPGAKSILELGSGTGRHAQALEKLGYEVTGVDMSEKMCEIARSRNPNMPIHQGDLRTFRLEQKFDVVISLFHVFSYQTQNQDLQQAFATLFYHLKPQGLAIFDYWHGTGVLCDLPIPRLRLWENNLLKVERQTTSKVDFNQNTVNVTFDLKIFDKNRAEEYILQELHPMRYLFLPEIEFFLEKYAPRKIEHLGWLKETTPTSAEWYAVTVIRF